MVDCYCTERIFIAGEVIKRECSSPNTSDYFLCGPIGDDIDR